MGRANHSRGLQNSNTVDWFSHPQHYKSQRLQTITSLNHVITWLVCHRFFEAGTTHSQAYGMSLPSFAWWYNLCETVYYRFTMVLCFYLLCKILQTNSSVSMLQPRDIMSPHWLQAFTSVSNYFTPTGLQHRLITLFTRNLTASPVDVIASPPTLPTSSKRSQPREAPCWADQTFVQGHRSRARPCWHLRQTP